MTKNALLVCICLLLMGCPSNEERQYSLQYPATLYLRNQTATELQKVTLLNSPEAKGAFVFSNIKVAAGGIHSFKIPEIVYEDISAGHFILRLSTPDQAEQDIAGSKLQRKSVHDSEEWSVTITITKLE